MITSAAVAASLWFVFLEPTPECIKKDLTENFIEFVDPKTKGSMRTRIRGQEPKEASSVVIQEKQPDIPAEAYDCYRVFVSRSDPKWVEIPKPEVKKEDKPTPPAAPVATKKPESK